MALLGNVYVTVLLGADQGACQAITSESVLRHRATTLVEPAYPAHVTGPNASGIAVADICVPVGSAVAVVNVPVAPDEVIRQAVAVSIKQWRFLRPEAIFTDQQAHSYGGKIIFYFLRQNDRWVVLRSIDSFYVGPTFAKPVSE
jgi:hypothetical protein